MMSIGLAALATVPATLPTTLPAVPTLDGSDGPAWLTPVLVVWAVVGLVAARGLGAFRRLGICGPERLGRHDSAWPLLALCGCAVVALIAGSVVATGVVGTVVRVLHAQPTPDVKTLLIGGLGEAIAVVAVLALVREFWSSDHAGLRLIGLRPRGIPNALAGGTAALFIVFPLIQLTGMLVVRVYRWLHLTQAKPHPVLEMMRTDHRPALAVAAVLTASVVAPVAEELLFRGIVQTLLGRLFNWTADRLGLSNAWTAAALAAPIAPPLAQTGSPVPLACATPALSAGASPLRPVARWSAVIVTSLAFAAVHGEPAFLAPIFVLSVGLGFVYERSGNLYMNIVTHSLFNTAQIVAFVTFGA